MLISGYRGELFREMEIIAELGEVVAEAGWLVGWLFSRKAPHVLLCSLRAVGDEVAEGFLDVLKILALEIHVVALGLMDGDLDDISI